MTASSEGIWPKASRLVRQAWCGLWWRSPLTLDLRSVALLRMGLAALALADIIQRAEDLQAHYTDWGLLPRGPLVQQFMHYAAACVHLSTGTTGGMLGLFFLHGLAAVALLVGWRSRLMAFVLWFLTYGLHLRNPMVLQGGDDLLRMLFFWGMFLPLGARFSVDAALHQEQANCQITSGQTSTPHGAGVLLNLATVAYVGQLLIMYACTSLFKTGAPWHDEGTAVYYALHYDQLVKPMGIWLRQFTWLLPILTHMTFWAEATAPFLLLMPIAFGVIRTTTCFLLISMHHAHAACLVLGLFPWIDTVSLLALLPPWFWHKLSVRIDWQRQKDVTIFYDDDCTFCKKMVQLIRQFLLLPHVVARPAQDDATARALMQREDSWVVQQGPHMHTTAAAFGALMTVSPLGWPFARLLARPRLAAFVYTAYRAVAHRRGRLSQISRRYAPWTSVTQHTAWPQQMVCAVAFLLVLAWNIETLNGPVLAVPQAWRTWVLALRLDQRWDMFAPFPATDDGWLVFTGKLDDGTPWDVWNNAPGPASFDKPAIVSQSVLNQRWSKYLMNLRHDAYGAYRPYFGQYICRQYNQDRPRHAKALSQFELFYVREDTLPNGAVGSPERMTVWRQFCGGQANRTP